VSLEITGLDLTGLKRHQPAGQVGAGQRAFRWQLYHGQHYLGFSDLDEAHKMSAYAYQTKRAWYEKHGFADSLITTSEVGGFDSYKVLGVLRERFGI